MFRCAGGQFGCNEYSGISPICRLVLPLLLSHKFLRIYPPRSNVFLVLKLDCGITELVESSLGFGDNFAKIHKNWNLSLGGRGCGVNLSVIKDLQYYRLKIT